MAELRESLVLSLQIALAATALAGLVAIPLAFLAARRRVRGWAVPESFLLIPLVLPPTVLGYVIIQLLGARGVVGQYLARWFDYSIMFRTEGAILASAIVALPLLYLPSKSAFANVEREQEEIARLFGANAWQSFWHVSLPIARRGICSGLVLGFARALGEFGATVMVFGWQPGKLTLPISIYAHYERGESHLIWPAALVLTATSIALLLAYNHFAGKRD